MMKPTVEKIANNKVKIQFEVAPEAFEEAIQGAYLKNRGRVNVPGFRKGRAPRKLIENMYGEGVFYEDALDALFPDLYRQAVEENDLKVVDRPSLDVENMKTGEALRFSVEVYVSPDVTLGEYKQLDVERGSDDVDDDAVDQEIERARQRNARESEITDRPVQDDDIVTLNYAGTVDGVAFEGGTAENQTLTIGSGSFIPGFEEQMVGMNVGEERDLTVKFPAEYHAEELAGREAIFHVKVNAIKMRELPELDDEFARDVSEFDDLNAYKIDVRAKLEADAKSRVDAEYENALVEKAAENAQMEIPEAMIADQVENMLRNLSMRLSYQGMRLEDFMKYSGQTEEALRAQYKPEAEKRVRGELTLEAIRVAEGIVADDADVEAAVADYATQTGKSVEEVKPTLGEREMGYLKDQAVVKKTIDFIKQAQKK